jgi:exopolysaccharide biosynthesis polyprenyl glycosylphosphotransferase
VRSCSSPSSASSVDRHPEWGLHIAAFVDDAESATDPRLEREVVYKFSDFPDLIRRRVVDEVVIAVPRSQLQLAAPVVSECAQAGVPVTVPADLFGDFLPRPRLGQYGRLPMLHFSQVPHSRLDLALKRLLDVCAAALLLALTAPVVALAALAIRLTSPGPVFFRQVRCGLNGRRFEMLKLRSMVVDAELRHAELCDLNEMDGPVFKIRNDPRTTPVGRLLRRWSIDECPQFWNVLKGDMSLVGPRPPLPEEVASYRNGERRRLSMRPGLTCLWQIGGRNDIGFEKWVELDLLYIDSWSLSLDLSILLRTPWAVLRRNGAC